MSWLFTAIGVAIGGTIGTIISGGSAALWGIFIGGILGFLYDNNDKLPMEWLFAVIGAGISAAFGSKVGGGSGVQWGIVIGGILGFLYENGDELPTSKLFTAIGAGVGTVIGAIVGGVFGALWSFAIGGIIGFVYDMRRENANECLSCSKAFYAPVEKLKWPCPSCKNILTFDEWCTGQAKMDKEDILMCPHCNSDSYAPLGKLQWSCPSCGSDLIYADWRSSLDNGEAENDETDIFICPHCHEDVEVQLEEEECVCPFCNNLFTYDGADGQTNTTAKEDSPEEINAFTCLFSMMAKIAKADGIVCKEEINIVTAIFDELDLDSDEKRNSINTFNAAKSDSVTIYEYAQQLSEICDIEVLEFVYRKLWVVAEANGQANQAEKEILKQITTFLGIPDHIYYECDQRTDQSEPSNITKYYELLECTERDTDQTIKQKYRKAVSQYHPDKIGSKELPKGFHDFAHQKVVEINNAYEEINKHRKNK